MNKRFLSVIRANRHYYSKNKFKFVKIEIKEDGKREIILHNGYTITKKTLVGSLNDLFSSLDPEMVFSYDHEELINMSLVWWKKRTRISLRNVVDYRRYFPHFDRMTHIFLSSSLPKKLSEILQCMEKKHLRRFSLEGDGKLECTSDDLQTIGKLSKKMRYLNLENLNDSSTIYCDNILDMIEIACIGHFFYFIISKVQDLEKMKQCLKKRKWVNMEKCDSSKNTFLFDKTTRQKCFIQVQQYDPSPSPSPSLPMNPSPPDVPIPDFHNAT